jgi:hypothetical protein
MPLEDIATHSGGKMYDLLMLKPSVWRTMCATITTSPYLTTWVQALRKHERNSMILGMIMATV